MTETVVHARRRPDARRRGNQFYRPSVQETAPERSTVCGADPTDRDVSFAQATSKTSRRFLSCPACVEATAEAALSSGEKAARTRAERASARADAEAELATPEGAARRDALIAELTR